MSKSQTDPPVQAHDPTICTVMTFNVGNGLVLPARLAAFLQGTGADVIGLQEVSAGQAAALAEVGRLPHQVRRGAGFAGRALLSRYPILHTEWLELSPVRSDLAVTLDLAWGPTLVLIAHPDPPRPGRHGVVFDGVTVAQIDALLARSVAAAPAILLGDFNMTPRHPLYRRLTAAGLRDAHSSSPFRGSRTFPLRLGRTRRVNHHLSWVPLPPLARVDYIWHTPDLSSERAWVGAGVGSDHRPVFARLRGPA